MAKPSPLQLQMPVEQSEISPATPVEIPTLEAAERPGPFRPVRRNPDAGKFLRNTPAEPPPGVAPDEPFSYKIELPQWESSSSRRSPKARGGGGPGGAPGERKRDGGSSVGESDPTTGESAPPAIVASPVLASPLAESPGGQRLKSPSTSLASFRPFAPSETGYDVPRPPSVIWVWVIALGCLAVGAAAGYFVPKPADATSAALKPAGLPKPLPPVADAVSAPRLTVEDQNSLDAAYMAWNAGELAEAGKLFGALYAKHPVWKSLEVDIGRIQLYQHQWSDAHAMLGNAAEKLSSTVDANFSLGILFTMRRQYVDAQDSFEKAVAVDPTRADIFFFWGESLRIEGKPMEASRKFRSALLRNRYETTESLYRLKLWLSEIDAGNEGSDGITAEIDAGLALPRPPMETLFAQAAREIKAGRFAEATGLLVRGRQSVEKPVFSVVMRDPVFVQEKWRSELAEFFQADAPVESVKPDEATLSPTPAQTPPVPGPLPVDTTAPPPAEAPLEPREEMTDRR